jgi:patatin-like phospholipase/acyl hydrolase
MGNGGGKPGLFRVLSLDGGGAKGFYTLGVLKEIEGVIGRPLCGGFDLVFGTSTGAIIAALICLGKSVDEIEALYREHVIKVMAAWLPTSKSAALQALAEEVFGDLEFSAVKTRIGIVATNWKFERPYIFKSDPKQAYKRQATFVPGFGVRIGDAVQASCSAYPLFRRKLVEPSDHAPVLLADGGYCANNPTLYAIADATVALNIPHEQVRVVSIGVGEYPAPNRSMLSVMRWVQYLVTVRLLQKTMEINTQSMEQLREVLFADVPTVRINERYTEPEMAADMLEHDMSKLGLLWSRGRQSFEKHEQQLRDFLL